MEQSPIASMPTSNHNPIEWDPSIEAPQDTNFSLDANLQQAIIPYYAPSTLGRMAQTCKWWYGVVNTYREVFCPVENTRATQNDIQWGLQAIINIQNRTETPIDQRRLRCIDFRHVDTNSMPELTHYLVQTALLNVRQLAKLHVGNCTLTSLQSIVNKVVQENFALTNENNLGKELNELQSFQARQPMDIKNFIARLEIAKQLQNTQLVAQCFAIDTTLNPGVIRSHSLEPGANLMVDALNEYIKHLSFPNDLEKA